MKITFFGTRGYIKMRTRLHYYHTATLVSYKGKRVLIDCGLDWLGRISKINPDAIVLTHGHPDHAWGLSAGAPCPVYATKETWQIIKDYPINDKRFVNPHESLEIQGMLFQVFDVLHSILAPAVGYRITAGNVSIFCVHDVLYINERHKALAGIKLYIGDGATLITSFVRKKNGKLFGHVPMRTQLAWCKKESVPRAIFTHCGPQVVAQEPRKLNKALQMLSKKYGVPAIVAYDGLEVILR